MKQEKISLSLLIIVLFFNHVAAEEYGKHDGGEYFCQRAVGSNNGKMYPYLGVWDVAFRSGDVGCMNNDVGVFKPFTGNMDFQALRQQFAIFNQQVNGHPFIYFDSAATAQVPESVITEMMKYYQQYKSNVGRGLYSFAELATQKFEQARNKIARFLGAQRNEIIFTSGATAGINLVAQVWAEANIFKGDEIVVSEVEHNANFLPWQQLASRKGAILKRVPLNQQGLIDVDVLKGSLTSKTKLVAVTHQSNILGAVNDVAAICRAAHAIGARVLIDAAQSVAHNQLNVKDIGCDFLVFSGHKLFGPTGVGVLFMSQNVFDECVLCNFGGGMVYAVMPNYVEFKEAPYCFEPGTQPIAQVIGLGACIDFIEHNINFAQVQEHEIDLVRQLVAALQEMPDIAIISHVPLLGEHCNMVTFYAEDLHAYDIAKFLNKHGIAVRAGYHCVQPYHDEHISGKATVRVSFAAYNTSDEVDALIHCLQKLFAQED